MKNRHLLSLLVGIMIFVGCGAVAFADPINVDMINSNGVSVISNEDQIRINDIIAEYRDLTGQWVTASLDVIFQWDTDNYILVPVAIVGAKNGQLRIQVSNSVTGEPLVNATVDVIDQYGLTDEDGIARFFGLPDTPLLVRIEAEGYQAEGIQVEIPCNVYKRIAIGLNPSPT